MVIATTLRCCRPAVQAVVGLAAFLSPLAGPVHAATPLLSIDISPDIFTRIDGLAVTDHDVATMNAVGNFVRVPLGSLPIPSDVDAFHRSPDGDLLLSVDVTARLGNVTVRPADIAKWDGERYTVLFYAASAGLPDGANIDAVSRLRDDLILSFDTTLQLGTLTVDDADLVRLSGSQMTTYFNASAAGIERGLDIDAANALIGGRILVSFDTGGLVGGVAFNHADVLEYDPQNESWEMAVSAAELPGWAAANTDSFAADTDQDGDAIEDSSDNCLATANADQRDSDNDGFGNICDADLNNDCVVNVIDLALIKTAFFSTDDDADFDGDGTVNVVDLGIMKRAFFHPPGPSGLAEGCGNV